MPSPSLILILVLGGVLSFALLRLGQQNARLSEVARGLSEQEKRYERLVDNLNQYFVYRKDASGNLLSVSDSVRRVLGFTREEFSVRHAASLNAASVDPDTTFEVTLEDAHGQLHRIELSEFAVRDPQGRVTLIDGIARDATAERRLREELRHAEDEAGAANMAKRSFLANMSHEIRTPLNGILGMAGLALRNVREPRDREYLEKIRTSARLLSETVEDVLDLSRIEAGRLELANEPFDLEEMLAEVADVIGAKAGARGIEVLFEPRGPLPPRLTGDVHRLKQVLLNLLHNAVKFTERGEIVARIETVETRRERVVLRFTVKDTGIGIAKAHLGALFEPFTQVDSSTTRRYGGMGLGLAMSRRLVRLMAGEIEVSSEPGKGSVFSFTAGFDLPEDRGDARRLPAGLDGLHALVVDDNESARLALRGMLEMLSCRVDVAASGEEAIAAFESAYAREPYRVALVDWKMPGLDGIETSTRLQALAGKTPLGVILVTAYAWDEAVKHADAAGIPTVLHKPLSPSALYDALVSTLSPGERRRAPVSEPIHARFEPGQSVLLVEDQPINRELARELLTQAGLTVYEAETGRAALEHLKTHRPDVVLMDVQMPDMDGLSAVEHLRADPSLHDLPVIAMTAHAMMGDRERFLLGGMSDYVPKPIEERRLFRALGRWLKPAAGATRATFLSTEEIRRPSFARSASSSAASRTAATPGPEPSLDRSAGLRRAGGNQALYERLLRAFVTDAPGFIARVRDSVEQKDEAGLRRELHTLKGNAATVSALEVARLAAALEKTPFEQHRLLALSVAELASAVDRLVAQIGVPPIPPASVKAEVQPLTPERRTETLTHLRVLSDHIASGNLAARRSFTALKSSLGGAQADRMSVIESSLSRLDFPAAIPEIDALRSVLSSEEGS